jgi:hypothetical protein
VSHFWRIKTNTARTKVKVVIMRGLFGLTVTERKLIEPLPPGASMAELSNRLEALQYVRSSVVRRMRTSKASAFDIVRYQADLVLVSGALESTVLRLRVAPLRPMAR